MPLSCQELKENKLFVFLNVGSYLVSWVLSQIAESGAFGDRNQDVSRKYQTLLTPQGLAFSIWGIVFIFEAVMLVFSIFNPVIVKKYFDYWFTWAHVFQILWTPFFCGGQIIAALIAMIGIWGSLFMAVYTAFLYKQDNKVERPYFEFWVIQFGVFLHFGWISAATVLNFNVAFAAEEASNAGKICGAIISLVALVGFTNFMGLRKPKFFELKEAPGDPVFPFVTGWATLHIYLRNANYKPNTDNALDVLKVWAPDMVIDGFSQACLIISIYSFGMVLFALLENFEILKFNSANSKPTKLNDADNEL